MKLTFRKINFITLTVGPLLIVGLLYLYSKNILDKEFYSLEIESSYTRSEEVRSTILSERKHLEAKLASEAIWNQMYSYVENPTDDFPRATYSDNYLRSLNLDIFAIYNKRNDLLWAREVDDSGFREISFQFVKKVNQIEYSNYLISTDFPHINDIIFLNDRPLLVVIHKVFKQNNRAESVGHIIGAKWLDKVARGHYDSIVDRVEFINLRKNELKNKYQDELKNLQFGQSFFSKNLSADKMVGLEVLHNLSYDPIVLMRVIQNRIYKSRAKKVSKMIFIGFLLLGLLFSGIIFFLNEKLIVSRVAKLVKGIREIEESKDLSYRLNVDRDDEVGLLSRKINEMLAVIEDRHNSVKMILDHIDQGLFCVDRNSRVYGEFSKKTTSLLGMNPNNKLLSDVLDKDREYCRKFIQTIYEQRLPLSDVLELGPSEITRDDKILKIKFHPIFDSKAELDRVLVITQNITGERQLEEFQKEQNRTNLAIVSILSSIDLFKECLQEIASLKKLVNDVNTFKIIIHNLKSKFMFMNCQALFEVCDRIENSINSEDASHPMEYYLALKSCLDYFLEKTNDILGPFLNKTSHIRISQSNYYKIKQHLMETMDENEFIQFNNELETELISENLMWLDEVAQSHANKLGKKLNSIVWQCDVRINPTPYSHLFNQLIHLVTNIVDHGIEFPDERENAEKPIAGNIKIEVSESESHIQMVVRDDGRGIDLEKLKEKSSAIHGEAFASHLSEQDLINLIFYIGFSTANEANSMSGQGVGLAGLKVELEKFDGKIEAMNGTTSGAIFHLTFKKFRDKELEEDALIA